MSTKASLARAVSLVITGTALNTAADQMGVKPDDLAAAVAKAQTNTEPQPAQVPAVKAPAPAEDEEAGQGKDDRTAADILVDIAESLYDFGVTDDGDTYALPKSGPRVVLLLRGGKTSLRAQLAREYRRKMRRVAPQQALASALLCIEGMAQEEEPATLHQRVARHGDDLWLDLGDQTGRAIRITANGWNVSATTPVLFRRTALTAALPVPNKDGQLSELWGWLNVADDDRPLIAASLVAALSPNIPHPVLGLTGEQGTGKTTATKVLVTILDPSPVPCRKAPRDAESWVTAASGSWMVALENLSFIPDWLSDSLCRAVTGDGDVRRKLYTDGDLAVFAFRRVIVANGIDFGALRGDLADRMLSIELEVIDEANRKEEEDFWPLWSQVHPRILGAVLTLASQVLKVLPTVHLERKPRMADFARILAAVDQVLRNDGAGMKRYRDKQASSAVDSLTGDPFILAMLDGLKEKFEGTATELMEAVKPPTLAPPKGWPTSPRQATTHLRRQAPVMRKAGWLVTDDGGNNHTNAVKWTITTPVIASRDAGISDSRDSRDSQPPMDFDGDRESASLASQESGHLSTRGAANGGAAA